MHLAALCRTPHACPPFTHAGTHALLCNYLHAGKGRGYTYFGAAKKLPGVKELFEAEPVKQVRDSQGKRCRCVCAHVCTVCCGGAGEVWS